MTRLPDPPVGEHNLNLLDVLRQAGFKGDGLLTAYAVVMAESGSNPTAHNDNRKTGDDSYGLFQINMIDKLGSARLKQFGLKSKEDLLDPLVNAKIAFAISNGGKDFGAWSTYNSGAYTKFLPTGTLPATGITPRVQEPLPEVPHPAASALEQVAAPISTSNAVPLSADIPGSDKMGVDIPGPATTTGLPEVPQQAQGAQQAEQKRQSEVASAKGDMVAAAAKKYLGVKYSWGGEGPAGVDCSGLVQLAYKAAGVQLPRVSYQQATSGKTVPVSQLRIGDLVAWDNNPNLPGADHIAIYLGNGKIIEAARPGTVVRERALGADEGAFGVQIGGI